MANTREVQTTHPLLRLDNDKTNRDLLTNVVSRGAAAVKVLDVNTNGTTLDYRYNAFHFTGGVTTATLPRASTWGSSGYATSMLLVNDNNSTYLTISVTAGSGDVFMRGSTPTSFIMAPFDIYRVTAIPNGSVWIIECVSANVNNFIPVLSGLTTAGLGTYSQQVGIFWKHNNLMFVNLILVWTAHTGTGQMSVSLPPQWTLFSPPGFHALHIEAQWPWAAGVSDIEALPTSSRVDIYTNSSGTLAAQNIVAAGTIRITGSFLTSN